jgi:3-hydroxyisobutyrate dehydrogenase
MKKIGLCGHGNMGSGIAANLLKAGHEVLIDTILTPQQVAADERLQALLAAGARLTTDLSEVFTQTEVLMTCLPNVEIVESVLIGPGGLLSCAEPSVKIVIDFSTTKPESTRTIAAQLRERGIAMLDTPMAGGPKQAREGTIKLAVGGDKAVFEQFRDLLSQVSADQVYIGPSGSGHAMKLINNFMGILNQTVTSAASLLCDQIGIDQAALYDFISMSGGNSWGFQNQFATIKANAFPLNFALDFAAKDIRYAKELFDSFGVCFEIVDDLASIFTQAQRSGLGSRDVGTVYHYLESRKKETGAC